MYRLNGTDNILKSKLFFFFVFFFLFFYNTESDLISLVKLRIEISNKMFCCDFISKSGMRFTIKGQSSKS